MLATSFTLAGQYNSSSILFGMAKHAAYARSLLVECVLLIVALWVTVPRYGILGAAWATATLMILNRGMLTPYLLCRNLNFSWLRYMTGIYFRPASCGIPVVAFAYFLKLHGLSGSNWRELFIALIVIIGCYFAAASSCSVDSRYFIPRSGEDS